jgi:hypothetical protein
VLHKEWQGLEIGRRTAESVFEGGKIVDVEGHHRLRAAGLKEPCNIFARDRVAQLRAAVLASIAQVRNDRRHPLGSGVLQSPGKEEQTAELVIRALLGVAIERMDREDVLPAHLDERADLVLTILKRTYLVPAKDQVQMGATRSP